MILASIERKLSHASRAKGRRRCPETQEEKPGGSHRPAGLNRRHVLTGGAGLGLLGFEPRDARANGADVSVSPNCSGDAITTGGFWSRGPYRVGNVKIEHTLSSLFPDRCLGDRCIIRTHVYFPTQSRLSAWQRSLNGNEETRSCDDAPIANTGKPWPLAVISSGFLVSSDQYRAYAEQLASYGYVSVLYDKVEGINSTIDDETSAAYVSEIITWLEGQHFGQAVRTNSVYLVGHSRGGKISLLAAESDDRIGAVCLIDPVDSNAYAPEGPGYPSAIRNFPRAKAVPIAIIGGGHSGDCIPKQSNFEKFFEGSELGPTLKLSIREAGHFQFLENTTAMQGAVCTEGKIENRAVQDMSKAVVVAWAEAMLPREREREGASGRGSLGTRLQKINTSVNEIKRMLTQNYGNDQGVDFQLKNFVI